MKNNNENTVTSCCVNNADGGSFYHDASINNSTVELNKGHVETSHFVLCREVVLYSEAKNVLVL